MAILAEQSNDSASATAVRQQADLALSKRVDDTTPRVGDTITYTVTLTNNGPDAATNVQVTDALPPGQSFESSQPSEGTYDPSTGLWSVGAVNLGITETLVILARVNVPGAETNTARISHADQFDPDASNNTASTTATPQQADLELTKTVSNATPIVGDTIICTIMLTDHGPDSATNVTVQDRLPAGVTFVSSAASQGSYNATTGVWTVGTVATAMPETLAITVEIVGSNPQVNTASISHSDQFDPNPSSDTSSTLVTPTLSAPVTVVSLKRFGYHHEQTLLVVGFSGALDALTAEDVSNYTLILIAQGGRLRLPLRIASVAYNPTAATVTIHPRKLLSLRFHYSLTINASVSPVWA